MDPNVAKTRSRVGVAHRRGNPNEIEQARQAHAAAMLADFIRRTVDAAPPLEQSQRDALAILLRGDGGRAA